MTEGLSQKEQVARLQRFKDGEKNILIATSVGEEGLDVPNADLVIFGKQSIDSDNSQTGQMFAALTGMAQATFASELKVEDGSAEVTREVDGGLETLSLTMPAIVSTDLRLNEPRYASLPNIMKAKRKIIDQKVPKDFDVDVRLRLETIKVEEPPSREAGVKVADAQELVSRLRDDVGVI